MHVLEGRDSRKWKAGTNRRTKVGDRVLGSMLRDLQIKKFDVKEFFSEVDDTRSPLAKTNNNWMTHLNATVSETS